MRPDRPERSGRVVLASVIAFLIIAAAVGAWLLFRGPSAPTAPEGQPIADAFLASIRNGKLDDAWQSTTAEFKSAEGRESFRRYVAKNPVLKQPLDFVSVETMMIGDLPRSEFLYRPPADAGKTVRVLVGEEFNEWKVDRILVE